MFFKVLTSAAIALTLAGCVGGPGGAGGTQWRTNYTQVAPDFAKGVRVTSVEVQVPASLTVSEQNTYTPNADIVWHGDPAGDRRAQVGKVVQDAVRQGTTGPRGGTPVKLVVVVRQFHALTPRARGLDGNVGVHDLRFTAQFFDARTGAPLSEPQAIEADMPALVGPAATDADARGFTQKVEITQHLVRVFDHWLTGRGEDPRGSFSRRGR